MQCSSRSFRVVGHQRSAVVDLRVVDHDDEIAFGDGLREVVAYIVVADTVAGGEGRRDVGTRLVGVGVHILARGRHNTGGQRCTVLQARGRSLGVVGHQRSAVINLRVVDGDQQVGRRNLQVALHIGNIVVARVVADLSGARHDLVGVGTHIGLGAGQCDARQSVIALQTLYRHVGVEAIGVSADRTLGLTVVGVGLILSRDGQGSLGHGQRAECRADGVVLSQRTLVQRVGERVGAAAHIGLRAGDDVGSTLARHEAVAGNRHVRLGVSGQRSSIVNLLIRGRGHDHRTRRDGQRTIVSRHIAVEGLVVDDVAIGVVVVSRLAHVLHGGRIADGHLVASRQREDLARSVSRQGRATVGHRVGLLGMAVAVILPGVVAGGNDDRRDVVGNSQGTEYGADGVVIGRGIVVQRVGEGIFAMTNGGLGTRHIVGSALAGDEATAGDSHGAVGQRLAVIHLLIRCGGQGDTALGDGQGVFASSGLVVVVESLNLHSLRAEVGDARSGGAPGLTVVGAVLDGEGVVADAGSGSRRIEGSAIVHLGNGSTSRANDLRSRSLGDGLITRRHIEGHIREVGAGVREITLTQRHVGSTHLDTSSGSHSGILSRLAEVVHCVQLVADARNLVAGSSMRLAIVNIRVVVTHDGDHNLRRERRHFQSTIHVGNGVTGGDVRASSVLDHCIGRDVVAGTHIELGTCHRARCQYIGADQGGGGSVAVRQGSTVIHLLIAGSGHRQDHRCDSQGTVGSNDRTVVVVGMVNHISKRIVVGSILTHIGDTFEGRRNGDVVAFVEGEHQTVGAVHRSQGRIAIDHGIGRISVGIAIIRPAVGAAGDGDVRHILRHGQRTILVGDIVVFGHILIVLVANDNSL